MCAPLCADPEASTMTCEQCVEGIHGTIDMLLSDPFIDSLVLSLAYGDFCQASAVEGCPEIVDFVLRHHPHPHPQWGLIA